MDETKRKTQERMERSRKRSSLKYWKGRDEEEDPGKDGEKK
jgi:hypothetical protein